MGQALPEYLREDRHGLRPDRAGADEPLRASRRVGLLLHRCPGDRGYAKQEILARTRGLFETCSAVPADAD